MPLAVLDPEAASHEQADPKGGDFDGDKAMCCLPVQGGSASRDPWRPSMFLDLFSLDQVANVPGTIVCQCLSSSSSGKGLHLFVGGLCIDVRGRRQIKRM